MQANRLVFRETAYNVVAITLCGLSLLGLLIWDRSYGSLVPELAFIVKILIFVSIIGILFSLAIPTIT
jgi:hypothetical protein